MRCWARYLFITVVSVLGIGQMIAACGQKGDLYLPKPEPKIPQAAATAANKENPPPQGPTGGESPALEAAAADAPRPGTK